jgi:hypothetical protein
MVDAIFIVSQKNFFMRMRIFFLLGLLISMTGFGQQTRTVSGKVTDLKDGAPFSGCYRKSKRTIAGCNNAGRWNIYYQCFISSHCT